MVSDAMEVQAITARLRGPCKWLSPRDTLLGTFGMPGYTAAFLAPDLARHGWASLTLCLEPLVVSAYCFAELEAPSRYTRVTIRESNVRWWTGDGYVLHGITPEQWEQLPGFTFAPSAVYLRSFVEG